MDLVKKKITISGITDRQFNLVVTRAGEYINFYRGPYLFEGTKDGLTLYYLDDIKGTIEAEIKQAIFLLSEKLNYDVNKEITEDERDYNKISRPAIKR